MYLCMQKIEVPHVDLIICTIYSQTITRKCVTNLVDRPENIYIYSNTCEQSEAYIYIYIVIRVLRTFPLYMLCTLIKLAS